MQFRISLYQIQADTCSLLRACRLGRLEETLKNIRLILTGNTDTCIGYRDMHFFIRSLQTKRYLTLFRSILHGIG